MKKIPVRDFFKLGLDRADLENGGQVDALMGELLAQNQFEASWASEHPNEVLRVRAITNIASPSYGPERRREHIENLAKIWNKALAEADSEQMVWTPVLDAVAVKIAKFTAANRNEVVPLAAAVGAQEKIWTETCTGFKVSELLEAIKHFKHEPIKRGAWRFGQLKGYKDVQKIISGNGAALEDVLENASLKWEDLERLVVETFGIGPKKTREWSVETIQVPKYGIWVSMMEKVIKQGGLPSHWGEEVSWPQQQQKLAAMFLAHEDVSEKILAKIFENPIFPESLRVEALTHPSIADKALTWLTKVDLHHRSGIWGRIIDRPETPELWLETLANLWAPRNINLEIAAKLIANKKISDQTALRIGREVENHENLGHLEKARVRKELAKRPISRTDPKIWNVLKKTQSQEVLVGMVEGAQSTEELKRAVGRLRKSSVRKLLQTLKEMDIPTGVKLTQKLLGPVLVTGTPKEREEAIGVLGRWGQAGNESKPEQPKASTRGGV